jgi:AraC family transcriptional regulator, regulatory protein of adaptative response / methylated-DNA-[protein]-cysteine methyltransferase
MKLDKGRTLDENRAWKQVIARDAKAKFLYGVTSTGVFCRPTCPSRRPARENVRFFASVQQAQAAGFRACRRCRPGEQRSETVLLDKLCAYIRANQEQRIKLADLAHIAMRSPFTVQRLFTNVLGISPSVYQRELRARRLQDELARKGVTVTNAIYEAGYSSASRVYEGTQLGMSPGRYRARGKGERIRFAIGACALGKLLVAATDKGLCAVTLGNDPTELEHGLRAQFPAAEVLQEDGAGSELGRMARQVIRVMGEGPLASELPLDLRATAFQMRVWQALRRIPRGETRSYAEVAREIGQPTAVRAVARACASNPVAVVIPCHRVVGSDGKLTGYRWGLERKRKLLELEALHHEPAASVD